MIEWCFEALRAILAVLMRVIDNSTHAGIKRVTHPPECLKIDPSKTKPPGINADGVRECRFRALRGVFRRARDGARVFHRAGVRQRFPGVLGRFCAALIRAALI